MYTRQDYLNDVCTHQQYYAQFVNSVIVDIVQRSIGSKRIVNSTDPSFNDIDLDLQDRLYYAVRTHVDASVMAYTGESMTLGTAVCIAKAAARAIAVSNELNTQSTSKSNVAYCI